VPIVNWKTPLSYGLLPRSLRISNLCAYAFKIDATLLENNGRVGNKIFDSKRFCDRAHIPSTRSDVITSLTPIIL